MANKSGKGGSNDKFPFLGLQNPAELPDVQQDLENAKEPDIKLPNPLDQRKIKRMTGKTSISALLTTPKPLTMWITTNCAKS